jgi:hypothetical protein
VRLKPPRDASFAGSRDVGVLRGHFACKMAGGYVFSADIDKLRDLLSADRAPVRQRAARMERAA